MRIFLVLIMISFVCNGQGNDALRQTIKGKVYADTIELEGIKVNSLKTKESTITDIDGNFSINVMLGDTLIFSSVNQKELRLPITKKSFTDDDLVVKMQSNFYMLNEVQVLKYDNINAISLGIVPRGIKYLPPAVRKYNASKSGVGLIPLLNLLSGQTAMLKKEVQIEKKEEFLLQIDAMFEEKNFIKNWKIPSEYVRGFKYYVVEDENFTKVLKAKNKTSIEFLMGQLAIKYLEIIKNESDR